MVYEFIPQFSKMLTNLSRVLDKAQAHADAVKFDSAVLFGSRLAPDMFPLGRQIQIACDFGKSIPSRLAGIEVPKWDDTEVTMADFKARKVQLLVATTVIEVGVDVPNASLMVIEHAERMGLAQLHQLRGRVGRGAGHSNAILLYYQPLSDMARQRLKVIYENNDGFEIARFDLALRGPGEYLGARQSGAPLLRFADLERDVDLVEIARNVAEDLINSKSPIVEHHLDRWLGTRQFYLKS